MKIGYLKGYLEGQEAVRELYERQLAILREEIIDLKADRNNQAMRADAACDLLLQHLGTRAISRIGVEEEAAAARNASRFSADLSRDPTDDLPIGTKGSLYEREEDAGIEGLGIVREPLED